MVQDLIIGKRIGKRIGKLSILIWNVLFKKIGGLSFILSEPLVILALIVNFAIGPMVLTFYKA
ncbi:MAG: hypothetical protein COB46_09040 [Rhodospirillaceae bacterium]|nr:MAG: hypothetical protein COB46_09040 [Rhodospirillaceae bacterium]